MNRRIHREIETIVLMIEMYCRSKHDTKGNLCTSCRELVTYAMKQTEKCRFGERKPVCSRCPVHCYKRDRRQQIREVMRYAGPRMMIQHPWLALMHMADKWKKSKFQKPIDKSLTK